ncbi:hypothetical protein SS50377_24616 [Spironucleus salmonicida]|uniref:Uncharacterized protein n=1 Tax=Spironucleus salmonicida TaxID=348837 RepID=V6LIY8_9EUKA|nr:hypothetical protein SS50377_24616 [Spironucleus salmonicida]|eukprot:EST44532.1 Hypothetical protein SS50377_15530 [Spironucleus salmonicida]
MGCGIAENSFQKGQETMDYAKSHPVHTDEGSDDIDQQELVQQQKLFENSDDHDIETF